MKLITSLLIAFSVLCFLGATRTNTKKAVSQFNRTIFDSIPIKFNGVYSLHDTTIGINCDQERYKRYLYISPIIFLNDGKFIQDSHVGWPYPNIIERISAGVRRFDFGDFRIDGYEITLDGTFTFFTRGMAWKQYKAKYVGYFDKTGDTLYLKLGEPMPKIKLKYNGELAEQLRDGSYQKYIFKLFSKGDAKIDDDFFENCLKRNSRLWYLSDMF